MGGNVCKRRRSTNCKDEFEERLMKSITNTTPMKFGTPSNSLTQSWKPPKPSTRNNLKHIRRFNFKTPKETLDEEEFDKLFLEIYQDRAQLEEYKAYHRHFRELEELKSLHFDFNINIKKENKVDNSFIDIESKAEEEFPDENVLNLDNMLNEQGDISPDNCDLFLQALNVRDDGAIQDSSYVYPYHDEPINNCSPQDSCDHWIKSIMNSDYTHAELRYQIVYLIHYMITTCWSGSNANRIIYGYYMAKDIYKFYQLDLLHFQEFTTGIIGINFNLDQLLEEFNLLDDKLSFKSIVDDQIEYFINHSKLNYDKAKAMTMNICKNIDNWVNKQTQFM